QAVIALEDTERDASPGSQRAWWVSTHVIPSGGESVLDLSDRVPYRSSQRSRWDWGEGGDGLLDGWRPTGGCSSLRRRLHRRIGAFWAGLPSAGKHKPEYWPGLGFR